MPSPQPGSGDHYFSPTPEVASAPRQIDLALPEGRLLRFTTDAGMFSPDRIDPGTRLLLAEGPAVASGATIADLGCGYGPIAVSLALRGGPGTQVWAVDVNSRARELCHANARANGVDDRIEVIEPDAMPDDVTLRQIWSNPPIRIGKEALHDLLGRWLDRLDPGVGQAFLVVNKNLGADSLARWLEQQGWPTRRTTSRAGYRILVVGPRS